MIYNASSTYVCPRQLLSQSACYSTLSNYRQRVRLFFTPSAVRLGGQLPQYTRSKTDTVKSDSLLSQIWQWVIFREPSSMTNSYYITSYGAIGIRLHKVHTWLRNWSFRFISQCPVILIHGTAPNCSAPLSKVGRWNCPQGILWVPTRSHYINSRSKRFCGRRTLIYRPDALPLT